MRTREWVDEPKTMVVPCGLVVVGKLERGAMLLLVRGGANVEGDGGDEGRFC